MSVSNTVPAVRIHQEFLHIPSELTEDLLAMDVGPHYHICRYAVAEEKALGYAGQYDGSQMTIPWDNLRPVGSLIDQAWTKIFIDNALLRYFDDPITNSSVMQVLDSHDRVTAADVVWRTANGVSRTAALGDRDVTIGDVVKIETYQGEVFWATVAGFDYDMSSPSATVDSGGADTNNQGVLVAGNAVTLNQFTGCTPTLAGTYAGLAAGYPEEFYTLVCTGAASPPDISTATFRVESASGTDDVDEVTFPNWGTAVAIGTRGVTLKFANAGTPVISAGRELTIRARQTYAVPVFTASGDSYTGTSDKTYVVTCVGVSEAGHPIVTFGTTDGLDNDGPTTITRGVAAALGSMGLTVTLTGANSACPGDKFYFVANAAVAGKCNTLILGRTIPDIIADDTSSSVGGVEVAHGTPADIHISLYVRRNIELPHYSEYPDENVVQTDEVVEICQDATVSQPDFTNGIYPVTLPVVSGDVYVQFRALLTTYNGGRSEISDYTEVESILGPAIVDNPLSLAVYTSARNSQGQPVGFISTAGTTLTDYDTALGLIRDDLNAYGIVPCFVEDADIDTVTSVNDSVKAHVLAQSAATRGRFRVCTLYSPSEKTARVSTEGDDGNTLVGKFIADDVTGQNTLFHSDHGNFVVDDIKAGDVIRAYFGKDSNGNDTYQSFVVKARLTEDRLRTMTGPANAASQETLVEIWRTRSGQEEATVYGGLSARLNDRRVRHVWPPQVTLSDGTTAPGWVLCAALAGLRSGAAPHQPLTNVTLTGFSAVPRTTVDMRESDLDIMANEGTWIVTQEPHGGAIYTRMALTTDTSDANHWQDVRTTNVDSISFGYNNRLKGLVGSTLVTERTLAHIANELNAVSQFYMSAARTADLGPQLISAEIISGPVQDETLKDTVSVGISLVVPYELDAIDLYLYVS